MYHILDIFFKYRHPDLVWFRHNSPTTSSIRIYIGPNFFGKTPPPEWRTCSRNVVNLRKFYCRARGFRWRLLRRGNSGAIFEEQ